MQSPIETVFDEAESRYLKTEELRSLGKYVVSLPERVSAYRALRDQELTIMQQVADQLQIKLPDAKPGVLERSLKNGILVLRYCAMGMLLADEAFVRSRLLHWLTDSIQLHGTQAIETTVYSLTLQTLKITLTPKQMAALEPFFTLVQGAFAQPEAEDLLTIAGMF
jgi:Phycobilisome protein